MTAVLLAASVQATDHYVRSDGGSAQQCDGRSDRALAADGRCAWSHPFFALPPGGPVRIAEGDTLHIASGNYRIGLGAPGADACSAAFPWDCVMPPLPARVRVLGDCDDRPELWGAERAAQVIDASGSTGVEIACLEITDRAACVENHCHGGECAQTARCERDSAPYGDWSGTGLKAHGARDLRLRDLDIHGLALRGVHAGGLQGLRAERVRIAGNGWSGWDGDIGAASANRGALHFVDVEIAWNGCAERWPQGTPFGCWGQGSGGYGDGLGTAATGGDWRFERAHVHHNASDGLDLLYLTPTGSVEVVDSRFEGNAGNQVKAAHAAVLTGNRISGDCTALAAHGLAQDDLCRAGGNAVVVKLGAEAVRIERNQLAGEGDCLLVAEQGAAGTPLRVRENRFEGRPLWHDAARQACGFYVHQAEPALELSGNQFLRVRNTEDCPRDNRCAR